MIYPVIMAGGQGTRFRPLSSDDFPKQFLNLIHPDRSMLQLASDRLLKLFPKKNLQVMSQKRYLALIRKQIPGLTPKQLFLEPVGKNTAPCIAWGALTLLKRDRDAGPRPKIRTAFGQTGQHEAV